MEYETIIKERIETLPEKLKDFVLSEEWRKEAREIGKKFNFDEKKYTSFENEIFFILIALESPDSFTENIKTEVGVDANVTNWIVEDVEKNIFSKIPVEIETVWQAIESEEQNEIEGESSDSQTQNKQENSGMGQDFEQIILNQARAMQSAIPPKNLPTSDSEPKKIRDYPIGSDPYREPVE